MAALARRSEQALVFLDRKRRIVGARRSASSNWRGVSGAPLDGVAGGRKIVEQRDDACRHVETDRISGAARRAGIVRHQDRDTAFARRRPASEWRGDPIRDHGDAIRLGPAGEST